jgi:hypothetical protein
MGHHELSDEELAKAAKYGSGDPVLPYVIAAVVAGLGLVAMLTVGKAVPVGTALAFVLVLVWGAVGLWIILIYPIVLWIPENRPYKWRKFFFSIILGIAYFVVSGILMAMN